MDSGAGPPSNAVQLDHREARIGERPGRAHRQGGLARVRQHPVPFEGKTQPGMADILLLNAIWENRVTMPYPLPPRRDAARRPIPQDDPLNYLSVFVTFVVMALLWIIWPQTPALVFVVMACAGLVWFVFQMAQFTVKEAVNDVLQEAERQGLVPPRPLAPPGRLLTAEVMQAQLLAEQRERLKELESRILAEPGAVNATPEIARLLKQIHVGLREIDRQREELRAQTEAQSLGNLGRELASELRLLGLESGGRRALGRQLETDSGLRLGRVPGSANDSRSSPGGHRGKP